MVPRYSYSLCIPFKSTLRQVLEIIRWDQVNHVKNCQYRLNRLESVSGVRSKERRKQIGRNLRANKSQKISHCKTPQINPLFQTKPQLHSNVLASLLCLCLIDPPNYKVLNVDEQVLIYTTSLASNSPSHLLGQYFTNCYEIGLNQQNYWEREHEAND